MHDVTVSLIIAQNVGRILQNAVGKMPLSTFFRALWTSSLAAETPRLLYLSDTFFIIFSCKNLQRKRRSLHLTNAKSTIFFS